MNNDNELWKLRLSGKYNLTKLRELESIFWETKIFPKYQKAISNARSTANNSLIVLCNVLKENGMEVRISGITFAPRNTSFDFYFDYPYWFELYFNETQDSFIEFVEENYIN